MSDSLKKELQDAAQELQQLASELRVKLHLAKMDVKTSWADLELRLRGFKDQVEHTAGDTSGQLRSAGHELKQRLLELKQRIAG